MDSKLSIRAAMDTILSNIGRLALGLAILTTAASFGLAALVLLIRYVDHVQQTFAVILILMGSWFVGDETWNKYQKSRTETIPSEGPAGGIPERYLAARRSEKLKFEVNVVATTNINVKTLRAGDVIDTMVVQPGWFLLLANQDNPLENGVWYLPRFWPESGVKARFSHLDPKEIDVTDGCMYGETTWAHHGPTWIQVARRLS